MSLSIFRRWLSRPANPRRTPPNRSLRLEALEGRAVPATFSVVNNLDSGAGSLRQAVADANTLLGTDTIVFAKSANHIALTTGALSITESVDIDGNGPNRSSISGSNSSRVFVVEPGATVQISDLTITRGRAGKGAAHYDSIGGAVLNLGNLILSDVRFTNNRAVGDPGSVVPINIVFNLAGGAAGGAIANFGSVVVSDCSFTGNSAVGADDTVGPITPENPLDPSFVGASGGGAISNYGLAIVGNSDFNHNISLAGSHGNGEFAGIGSGGAIYNDANLTVTGSSFRHNQAIGGDHSVSPGHNGHALGGAIASGSLLALLGAPGASLFVSHSDFDHNRAAGGHFNETLAPILPAVDGPNNGIGGGITVYQGSGTVNMTTFDHNLAVGGAGGAAANGSLGAGGGLMLLSFIGPVTGTVTNCELTNNDAVGGWGGVSGAGGNAMGGGMLVGGLGSLFSGGVVATVANTTVRGNQATGGLSGIVGDGGDGLGGGVFIDAGSTANFTASSITRNRALGGCRLFSGSNGDGIGGGVYNLGTFNAVLTAIQQNHASTSNDNIYP